MKFRVSLSCRINDFLTDCKFWSGRAISSALMANSLLIRREEYLPPQSVATSILWGLVRLAPALAIFSMALITHNLAAEPPAASEISPPSISDGWVATDALGRKLPEYSDVGDRRADKYVALFYWTWHLGGRTTVGPVNVQQIISRFPEATNDFHHPIWDSVGRVPSYHWNEPLFGYYHGEDPWIYRKHAEMLADAGVDVVVFDCTNGTFTWKEAVDVLGEVWMQARRDGVRTPQFAFLCPFGAHNDSRDNITKVYQEVYEPRRFEELWFQWRGRPLIMGYPDNLPKSIQSFFTFRPGQPDYRRGPRRPDHWGWLEVHPQQGYVETQPGKYEQMTVGVAQNATDKLAPAAMNDPDIAYGRGYTKAFGFNHEPSAIASGLNFQEQWNHVLERDPELVFVTGWNEWIAGRYEQWQGTSNAFPDQYNDEFSRDIEPMKGGFSDNYYYQMVANIRRFKGLTPSPSASSPVSIDLLGSFQQWQGVQPEFRHHRGSTLHRDHRGYGKNYYKNSTGRNDFVLAQVARDSTHFYFAIKTAATLTPPEGMGWMCLLLDVDRDKKTGWEGYDFVVNRLPPMIESASRDVTSAIARPSDAPPPGLGAAVLERFVVGSSGSSDISDISDKAVEGSASETANSIRAAADASDGGAMTQRVAEVSMRYEGDQLMMAIPRQLLGLREGQAVDIEFKWVDNISALQDITDFYSIGDAAPGGRFNYLYQAPAE
jgi:hypothetical protein